MKEIRCEDCIGACCTAGMQLPLRESEVITLRAGGTVLHELLLAKDGLDWSKQADMLAGETPYEIQLKTIAGKLTQGLGLYALQSDCVFLGESDNGMRPCLLFDQPNRPEICRSFTAGNDTCRIVRLTRGIWDY